MSEPRVSRPKINEDESELLKLQEQFMQKSQSLSVARVERIGNKNVDPLPNQSQQISESGNEVTPKRDLDIQSPATTSSNKAQKRVKFGENVQIPEPMDTIDPAVSESDIVTDDNSLPVILDIVERDISNFEARPPKLITGQSFPKACRRKKQTSNNSNLSLFAQQMQNTRAKKIDSRQELQSATNTQTKSTILSSNHGHYPFGDTSVVLDGAGLGDSPARAAIIKEIHDENVAKLSRMSQDEILKEQQRLLTSLDPNLVAFLKKKRSQSTVNKKTDQNYSPNLSGETQTPPSPNQGQNVEDKPSSIKIDSSLAGTSKTVDNDDNEFPIPLSRTKRWLNMDKVERDKLAWTTDLPVATSGNAKTGLPARFDFEGTLISFAADLPTHVGLHHHGEDAEMAGYTLEELFIYGRSSVLQQRVLALTTLANILKTNNEGRYDECLTEPLLPQLLDAGLVLLLRWALDDNSENNVAATVAALHSLVVVSADEVCLNLSFNYHRSEEIPFLQPQLESPIKSGFPEERADKEEELSDAELVKLDVVKGFVRMDLLPRLRYILEVGSPDAAVTVQILEILTRVARHSMELAYEVVRCPRLLQVIVANYLPSSWNIQGQIDVARKQLSSATGVPLCQALKLIRVLASSGRNLAAKLLTHDQIATSMLCYASIDSRDSGLPTDVTLNLCIECYKTWKVFLHYGLMTQQFVDFYPLLMRQVQCYQTLCLNLEVSGRGYDYDHAASVLGLLASAVRVASATDRLNTSDASALLSNPVGWCHVEQFVPVVLLCLKKWMWEFALADELTHSSMSLLGSTLAFLTDYYEHFVKKVDYNPVKTLEVIEKLLTSTLIPFLESGTFRKLLVSLTKYSSLVNPLTDGSKRYPSNLPVIGSIFWDGALIPCFANGTTFSLLPQLVRCIHAFCRLHRGQEDRIRSLVIDNPLMVLYLHRLIKVTPISSTGRCWLSRFETHFLHHLCMLASLTSTENAQLYHKLAIVLLPILQQGDENMAMQLLPSIIFNSCFIPELNDLTTAMESLGLQERAALVRPTLQTTDTSKLSLLYQTGQSLASICQTFRSTLARHFAKFGSHNRRVPNDSLAVQHFATRPVSAVDFSYLPITQLYRKVTLSTATPSAEDALATLHSLQWCHLVECWRTSAAPAHLRFCYLCLVFLVSPDLFLETQIGCYLDGCLQQMCEQGDLSVQLLETAVIPEVASFQDLYFKLLEQFEAVSYGDSLFGNVIMVPLQRKYSMQLRRTVFTENVTVVRALQLKLSQLKLPFEAFSQPVETDLDVLACYFRAIVNGIVHPVRNQFLYVLAIHHLHHALFAPHIDDSLVQLKNSVLDQLRRPTSNSDLLIHLRFYKEHDAASKLGFSCTQDHL